MKHGDLVQVKVEHINGHRICFRPKLIGEIGEVMRIGKKKIRVRFRETIKAFRKTDLELAS